MTQPPDPPEGRQTSGSAWHSVPTALIGFAVFIVVNVVLLVLSSPGEGIPHWRDHVIVGAAILLLMALAGVALTVRARSYAMKGLGIGLMIGWGLASIVSAGYCTGLNVYPL